LPDAHAAQAYVNLRFRWDWAGAEREIKRALELNPNSSEALQMYGLYLILMARYDEGIAAYRRALELDPLNFLIDNRLGWAYSKAGRLDESITHLGNLARLNPEKLMAHYNLAHAYAFKGMYDEAMQHVRIGQRNLVDTASTANFDYAWVIAVSGHRKEAEDLIKAMLIYRRHHYLDPMTLALAYVGLGENEKALQWLEEGYKQHARFMIFLKSLHQFDGLRFDPRFRDLMRQMNFPAE
jgi:serine/threonine-protein kinase